MKLLINTYSILWLLLAVVTNVGISQISTKDNIVYTTEITVKFKSKAFDMIEPAGFAQLGKMRSELRASKNYFEKHAEVRFRQVFPDAIWGDTLRTNKFGETVVVPDLSQFFLVIFPKPVKMWETVFELRKVPDIESADPPTFAVPDLTPNDLHGRGNQWNLTKVNATSAWDITTGSSSIKVAVIDNGVDASHPDLSTKLIGGEIGYSSGADNHGTRVAGVVGAATDNGIGIASLGWNVKVMPFNKDNGSWLDADIRTAVDSGAHVLNCSWRIVAVDPTDNTKYINYDDWSIRYAIQYAVSMGKVVVASAGNPPGPITFPDGVTRNPSESPPFLQYPAANPGVIAVSATNSADQFPSGYNYGSHVDVSAPSISILTTVVGNTYSTFDGTSFGAPLVSALAGLILSIDENLENYVEEIIENSSTDLGPQGRDDYYGYGRINAHEALKYTFENYNITLSGNHTFYENIFVGATLTIASDANITFDGSASLVINQGATLVVNPSATLNFTTGSLTVNGTITANGTSGQITFNSTGSSKWGGIKLQSTASSNSVITYCTINNANQGIYVGLTPIYPSNFPTIENNTLTNCNDGIYLYDSEGGASKPLRFNTITNSINGIRFEGLASSPNYVWITDNTMTDNESGIVMRNAHPRLFRNIATCNVEGVKVENYSYPKFAGTELSASGYNRFADNYINNLYANNNVNVWMGQINEVDEGRYGGYNTLGSYEDSQNPWRSFIQATNQSLVMTNYSYFGTYPPVSWKIGRDGTSSIDYSAYLNWDPVPGQSCSQLAAGVSNSNYNKTNSEVNTFSTRDTSKLRVGGFATKGVKKNIPTLLLYFGMHHYLANKLDAASRVFYQIINTYPDSSESIFALNLLTRMLYESKVDTIYNFISKFESRFGQNPNKNSYALYKASLPILAGALIRQNNIPNALSVYDKIIERFPESENAKYSIYSKLAYYVNIENNLSMASILYNQLESQFPNDPLLVDALILLGDDPSPMLAKVKINKRQNFQKKNEVQKSDVDNLIIEDFSLEQNYPNPFNPSTIIQYQIPIAGNVKLKVFDLLGREVAELINQEQTEGVYRIIFGIDSGKKLSSGVYYYSIEVKGSDGRNYRNVKKMTILK